MQAIEDIVRESRAERLRLVDLFTDLTPDQWGADSLCSGWRVREVLAHITMPFRTSPARFVVGLVRARFDFNRFADRDAHETAEKMSDAELLDLLRANIDHPWTPPGGGKIGALSHDVIHGLDITTALGLPGPPADRIAMVLASSGAKQLEYFGVDLNATRLQATDADVSIGEGQLYRMPAAEMLLIVTGRRALTE